MLILRDISFLWSMLHTVVLFLILFEPRCTWRTALTVGFAGVGTLLIVNVLLMYHFGGGIIMSVSFFTCTVPTLLIFFLLSKYRDGRFFFLFCLSDTVCFWLLQVTNFLDRYWDSSRNKNILGTVQVKKAICIMIPWPSQNIVSTFAVSSVPIPAKLTAIVTRQE